MSTAHALSISEEHRFWLGIMGEHVRFLTESLGTGEQHWREQAAGFAAVFHSLQNRLETLDSLPEPSTASAPGWVVFAKNAYSATAGYYKLEGKLQALRLADEVQLELTPQFLNSTLTESQEYLRLLQYYVQGADPPVLPLWDLMELWLPDQLNHGELLEKRLKAKQEPLPLSTASLLQELQVITDRFRSYLIRNRLVQGFLRFTPPDFPEQLQLAAETAETVHDLYRLVQRVLVLDDVHFRPFLQHQLTEASYFMNKLAVWIPEAGMVQDRQ